MKKIILLGLSAIVSLSAEYSENLVNTLRTDPVSVLRHLNKLQKDLSVKSKKLEDKPVTKGLPLYQKMLAQYEQECPITLLGECELDGDAPCVLSRECHPEYRKAYEDGVVSALIKRIDEKNGGPVHYVSFGSGGLFQDLVIVTQTLHARPQADLHIHFINVDLEPYLYIHALHNGSFDVAKLRDKLKQINQNVTEEQVKITLIDAYIHGKQIQEFIKFFELCVPGNITVYAYETAQNYISDMQANNFPIPDMVTAADIFDEYSLMYNSLDEYMWLCAKALELNSSVPNILLIEDENNEGELWSISGSKTTQATEIDFEYEDVTSPLYITRTKI